MYWNLPACVYDVEDIDTKTKHIKFINNGGGKVVAKYKISNSGNLMVAGGVFRVLLPAAIE